MTQKRSRLTVQKIGAPVSRDALSERERQFVEHFMATGNATKAAEQAGYSKKTASQIGYRLLRKVQIQRAIAERAQSDPAVWTREERQRFWTAVASGTSRYESAALRDRLKASELLGRSQADFIDRHQVDSGPTLAELIGQSRSLESEESSRLEQMRPADVRDECQREHNGKCASLREHAARRADTRWRAQPMRRRVAHERSTGRQDGIVMRAGRAGIAVALRTRGKSPRNVALLKAARSILAEIQPASVRAVCYRLFTMKLIAGMTKGETNRVSEQLTWAREHAFIPWGWVVDETRAPERVNAFTDPQDYVETVKRSYRKNRWTDQPEWIECWSEKGTVRGTLAPVLNAYGITLRVLHGYGSATAVYQAAQDSMSDDDEKLLTVLYVGDHDGSTAFIPERQESFWRTIDADGGRSVLYLARSSRLTFSARTTAIEGSSCRP